MAQTAAVFIWAFAILYVICVFAVLNTSHADKEEKAREDYWKRYERK